MGHFVYEYPRPMITVDAVVFARDESCLWVALIRRRTAPFAGAWALPGGFVEPDEPLADAAARELAEETGLRDVALDQFHTFGEPGRDPRGRSISVAYRGFLSDGRPGLHAADDAAEAAWHEVNRLPPLAFDHAKIIRRALQPDRENPTCWR